VPAAAVIPAPIAYIKIVAVKKLVVGFLVSVAPAAALVPGVSQLGRTVRGVVQWDGLCPSRDGLCLTSALLIVFLAVTLFCWRRSGVHLPSIPALRANRFGVEVGGGGGGLFPLFSLLPLRQIAVGTLVGISYFEQIRVFKAGGPSALNISAWYNNLGLFFSLFLILFFPSRPSLSLVSSPSSLSYLIPSFGGGVGQGCEWGGGSGV